MTSFRPIPGRLWIIQLAEVLHQRAVDYVKGWPSSDKQGIGDQWIRSTESIGENLSEGYARFHLKERLHFFSRALGSMEEALFQLRRARDRGLVPQFEAATLSGLFIRLSRAIHNFIRSERMNENDENVKAG